MTLWHKKGALSGSSELEDKKHVSHFFDFNFTLKGWWIQ